MKLAELERFFSDAVTSGSGPRADLEAVFLSDARLSASDRLAIYNRGYYYRLLDALGSVFAQTARVLGNADFERLALAYLTLHPSEHPAVERVGRLFPQYLRELGEIEGALADLADLEWARLSALVAPNPSTVVTASSIDPALFPSSRLVFVPALRWLELDVRALKAFAGEELGPRGTPSERCGVAVWRKQHTVVHEQLQNLHLASLQLAAEGAPVSRICSHFETGSLVADTQRALEMLASWLAREWLEGVEMGGA